MNPLMRQTNRWIDPFDLVTDLQDDMNRLFSSSLRRGPQAGLGEFLPSLEVKEDENQFQLHLDIPGMERKDLDISVSGNVLTVKGERKEEEHKKGKGYFYSERRYGSFQRSVELPVEVDADKVAANYKDGVLELVLPKSEKAKPKQIKVDVK
jgi:HSP20 family protein